MSETKARRFPVLFVDSRGTDVERIVASFHGHGYELTNAQARQIAQAIGPLPIDDNDLWIALSRLFVVDLAAVDDDEVTERHLRELAERYEVAKDNAKRHIERLLMAATDGLTEHPDWFQLPCLCDLCRSYGDPE